MPIKRGRDSYLIYQRFRAVFCTLYPSLFLSFVRIQLLLPPTAAAVVVIIVVASASSPASLLLPLPLPFLGLGGRYKCCCKCIFKCNEIITQLVKLFCGHCAMMVGARHEAEREGGNDCARR